MGAKDGFSESGPSWYHSPVGTELNSDFPWIYRDYDSAKKIGKGRIDPLIKYYKDNEKFFKNYMINPYKGYSGWRDYEERKKNEE